jgi:hypothetical protein
MLKHTLTAAALAALLTTPAFAQQPTSGSANKQMQSAPAPQGTTSNPNESRNGMVQKDASAQQAGFMQRQDANEWRSTELVGASIYGPDDKSIGEINEVLIGKDGRVTAVVVGVGGFLGVGEKNVALQFNALNVQRKDGESAIDKITVSYTKNQLNSAPSFAYYEGGQAETTGAKVNESTKTPMAPAAGSDRGGNASGSMKK